MFEHFWARFVHGTDKPKSHASLRTKAMRSLYLEEGRSHTNKPASGPVWLRIIGKLKKHLGRRKE